MLKIQNKTTPNENIGVSCKNSYLNVLGFRWYQASAACFSQGPGITPRTGVRFTHQMHPSLFLLLLSLRTVVSAISGAASYICYFKNPPYLFILFFPVARTTIHQHYSIYQSISYSLLSSYL